MIIMYINASVPRPLQPGFYPPAVTRWRTKRAQFSSFAATMPPSDPNFVATVYAKPLVTPDWLLEAIAHARDTTR